MILLILVALTTILFLHEYLRTRRLRDLWATAYFLFLTGLKVLYEFFVPLDVLFSWLGWFNIPLFIFLILGLLSIFWICFMPKRKRSSKTRVS